MLVATLLLLAASEADASPTTAQAAAQASAGGDVRGARALFEQALSEGGNDVATLQLIHLELGVLRAVVGEAAAAEQAFSALLSLAPDAALPPGVPAVAAEAFARAKTARGQSPPLTVDVTAQDPTEAGRAHRATLHVSGDTAGIVRGARATILSGPRAGATVDATGTPPIRLDFPRDATPGAGELRYRIEALDGHGSIVASVGTDAAPRVVRIVAFTLPTTEQDNPSEDEAPSSAWSSPWLWGGVAAVVVAAVTVGLLVGTAGGSDVGRVGTPEIR